MKRYLIYIIFFLLFSKTYGQKDTKIYTNIIKTYIINKQKKNITLDTIFFLKKIKYESNLIDKDYNNFKQKIKKLEKDTFENFLMKFKQESELDSIKVKDIVIVKLSDLESKNKKFTYEISRIGFNKSKTQALIYYGFYGDPMVGGGIFIFYEKKKGKWKEKRTIPAWAS